MKDNTEDEVLYRKLLIELRRGDLVLAALCLLEQEDYGYGLIGRIREAQMEVSQDTLYPLLRRLEGQGLLEGDWETTGSRPRKIYRITSKGREIRQGLKEEWIKQKQAMEEWI